MIYWGGRWYPMEEYADIWGRIESVECKRRYHKGRNGYVKQSERDLVVERIRSTK